MKTRSAKNKGRRAAVEVKELLLKHYPDLEDKDFWVTPSGVPGPDVCFSPKATEKLPIVIEVKNQESISIWEAYEQAKSHKDNGSTSYPVLFFRRNRSDLMVCLSADDFMKLVT